MKFDEWLEISRSEEENTPITIRNILDVQDRIDSMESERIALSRKIEEQEFVLRELLRDLGENYDHHKYNVTDLKKVFEPDLEKIKTAEPAFYAEHTVPSKKNLIDLLVELHGIDSITNHLRKLAPEKYDRIRMARLADIDKYLGKRAREELCNVHWEAKGDSRLICKYRRMPYYLQASEVRE